MSKLERGGLVSIEMGWLVGSRVLLSGGQHWRQLAPQYYDLPWTEGLINPLSPQLDELYYFWSLHHAIRTSIFITWNFSSKLCFL